MRAFSIASNDQRAPKSDPSEPNTTLPSPYTSVASSIARGPSELLSRSNGAARVAARSGVPADWLNDAVKDYLSERGEYRPWLESSHLRVMVAQPAYLLAMKCPAFRIGAEFHDEDDVRFLLRLLDLRSYAKALETIGRYYPKERFPQKTLYALAELLPED